MPKTILSVDDSKMVHMIVTRAFKDYDVQVITASNGAEGVKKATENKPDVVLMDMTMPEMTGLEALSRIKQNPETAGIPVVMLTAEGTADSMEKAFEAGAQTYLTKPFTEDVIINALSTVIDLQKKA